MNRLQLLIRVDSRSFKCYETLANEGMTMVVVTHEMAFAKNVSSHVILMEKGKIVEEGSSKNFFENPKQERTKDFFKERGNVR